ncbi:MAG: Na(+)/H(+) antiporter subunit D, partial [Pseudomonadota bacterium]
GLLSMSIGAVLYSAGTARFSALGGLWRSMPLTALFALIGAFALSGLPLFLGGVTLPMVLSVVAGEAGLSVQIGVLIGLAGLTYGLCLRLPVVVFFGEDSRQRPAEAPFNMLLAMGLSALVCLLLAVPKIIPGLGYDWIYSLLPCSAAATDPASCLATGVPLTGFEPYNTVQMLPILQVTFGAALGFLVIRRVAFFRGGASGVVLDTDWLYRKWGYGVAKWSGQVWQKVGPALSGVAGALGGRVFSRLEETFSPRGALARTGLNSGAAIWSAVLLGVVMMVVLISS